jgi:hypothetical protein
MGDGGTMSLSAVLDIDEKTKTSYALMPDVLGQGGTATVRLGRDMTQADRPPVAVKIAHAGMPPTAMESFWAELSLIKELHKAQTDVQSFSNLPWAHKGSAPDTPDAAIIILEWIPDGWQLTRLAQQHVGRLPEDVALAAGIQYAAILKMMHERRITMWGDRKATDLRWDADNKRLIVLDWNRAGPIPNDFGPPASQELIRQDLRVFGQLWSNLVLGQTLSVLPGIDDVTLPAWAELSRGLRIILARASGARPSWGYPDAIKLHKDLAQLEAHKKLSPTELLAQAQKRRVEGQAQADPGEQAQAADDVLTLLDLARRGATDQAITGDTAEKFAALQTWADQTASKESARVSEAVSRICRELKLQNYDGALQAARDALGQSKGQPALRLLRWQLAAEAGVRGNQLKCNMNTTVTALTESISLLEQATHLSRVDPPDLESNRPLETVSTALAQAATSIPTTASGQDGIPGVLRPLDLEVIIRRALAAPAQRELPPLVQVPGLPEDALTAWRKLEQIARIYAGSLRAEVRRLDEELGRLQLGDELSRLRGEARSGLEEGVTELRKRLDESHAARWPGLDDVLAQARRAISRLNHLDPDGISETQPAIAFVQCVSEVNDRAAHDDIAGALDFLCLPSQQINQSDWHLVAGCCQGEALVQVRGCIKEGGDHWPGDLARGQAIIRALKAMPPIASLRQDDLSDLERSLAEWSDELREHRVNLGLRTPENWPQTPHPDDYASLLQDPDDKHIDAQLLKAHDIMEVLDRRGLEGQIEPIRVRSLLSMRRLARLKASAAKLLEQLSDLKHAITEIAASLPPQNFNEQLDQLDHAISDAANLQLALDSRRPVQVRERVRRMIQEFDTLTKDIDGVEQRWPELAAKLDRAEEERGKLANRLPPIQETIFSSRSAFSSIDFLTKRARRMRNAEKLLAPIRSKATISEQSIKRIESSIALTWVAAGLRAARELRLDGDDGAQACLEQARRLGQDRSQPGRANHPGVELLTRAVDWLHQLAQDGQASQALQSWREALEQGDLEKAETQRRNFEAAPHPVRHSWVVAELAEEHRTLCQQARATPSTLSPSEPESIEPDTVEGSDPQNWPEGWKELIGKWSSTTTRMKNGETVPRDEAKDLLSETSVRLRDQIQPAPVGVLVELGRQRSAAIEPWNKSFKDYSLLHGLADLQKGIEGAIQGKHHE